MSDFIFIFDLDSTITKNEILPTIAQSIHKESEMRQLTEMTMSGDIPFKKSFLQRVELLKDISVKSVSNIIRNIPLNEKIVDFIKANKKRCLIVTGNLDCWIYDLMLDIGMEKRFFSSRALVKDDKIESILSVADKHAVVSQMVMPYVAIGDGDNDAEMLENAVVGIGYGGVRQIAPSILECATHATCEEETLCQFLEQLL